VIVECVIELSKLDSKSVDPQLASAATPAAMLSYEVRAIRVGRSVPLSTLLESGFG